MGNWGCCHSNERLRLAGSELQPLTPKRFISPPSRKHRNPGRPRCATAPPFLWWALVGLSHANHTDVGIVLHYSTLSTMLWIGVTARNIYKQVTKKAPLCPGADQPPYPKQPLLRY
ncbi:hypothetical protein J1605_003391 [Eschrichtius robustus]|uniref:Uncharacterized protein n=1 Tax=Eschrichtius robustus TaxID=9764 RepID=A0AB34HQL6_ESCRO|nr:hypothetical protein J1605_003391 [Eschrichtius robustus]